MMKKHFLFFCLMISLAHAQQTKSLNLMPWPKEIKLTGHQFLIDRNFKVSINQKKGIVFKSAVNFIRQITNKTGVFIENGFPSVNNKQAQLVIRFKDVSDLSISSDESYTLTINKHQIIIDAITDVGASYGLSTLVQLLTYHKNYFYFPTIKIKDAPRFKWRGLLIDVARHFQPVEVLKRNLRAMAALKMNVFHWHLTDDQGFRIEVKKLPKLTELASDGLYYTQEQIKEVVQYASDLGIRVLPEIDVPGHATSILTAYPEFASKKQKYEIERFAGIFNPTLDPTNEKTYLFLDTLLEEITPLFKDAYFHIGGDENEGKHWDENKKIQDFKKLNHLKTNSDLQTYFNIRLEKILKKYGKKLMGWDEILTPEMPKTAVIHSWRGGSHEGLSEGGTLIKAVKLGYQAVLSLGFYIDLLESVTKHYQTEPIGDAQLTIAERYRVLGGEATMWSELVTPTTIDSRIWPRTAAIAERLWSDKAVTNVDFMLQRLEKISVDLEDLGLTHIKNRDVVFRNLTKGQSTKAIKMLADISEPLKQYTRNKGGTEYKTFSPFKLFADACVADAKDAFGFNKSAKDYLKDKSNDHKNNLINYFKKWQLGYKMFGQLKMNPNLLVLKNRYECLANISNYGIDFLSKKKVNRKQIQKLLDELDKPVADTELMIVESLKTIFSTQ